MGLDPGRIDAICKKALRPYRRMGLSRSIGRFLGMDDLMSIGRMAILQYAPEDEGLAVEVVRAAVSKACSKEKVRQRGAVDVREGHSCHGESRSFSDMFDRTTYRRQGIPEHITSECIWEAMRALSGREYRVAALHFWGGKSQGVIADELGLSQSTVSRVLDSAKKILASCIIPDPQRITNMRGKETQRTVPSSRKDAA
jgi:RNA polymerase sigma factor (sigma-70 family)